MRVSQQLDYTLRALVELAREPGRPVSGGEVARRLGLPRRFLEQQLTSMGRAGLVRCRRGTGGGCELAVAAEDITVADVVRAVQGEVLDVPHTAGSAVAEMWAGVVAELDEVLDAVTIAELARRQRVIGADATSMYWI
ncbi:MAG: Rrf2 family transcriptional regulator [Coriobacteriia bacterium]|nr:Rrf2 family transcriptional regulator [Coriobacteriia bacterium]